MAEIAARKVGAGDAELIDAPQHLGTTEPVSVVAPMERIQHRLAQNTLMSLLVDGVKAYDHARGAPRSSWLLELCARSTLDVVLAIRDGDAQEAARLHSVELDVFDGCHQVVVVSRVSVDLLV